MSLFSEILSEYMDRSGYTVKALAETAGYNSTHLIKIKKGDRPAKERDKLNRLIAAMRLTPLEEERLLELWKMEQVGKDNYHRHMAVKALIESLNRHIDVTPPVTDARSPEGLLYSGKENVRYMLHRILGSGTAEGGDRICIMAQPEESMFSELLLALCSMEKPVSISHIISLFPGSAEKRHQIENLAYIQNLLPCIMSNPDYEINYYYDDISSMDNHYLVMPNVFLTSDSAVLVSKQWDNAVISRETEVISFYRSMFEKQLRVTRPFKNLIPSLFHEVEYLVPLANAGICENPDEFFYAVAQQPCITPYFTIDEAEYVSDEYENKQALLEIFLNQYQPYLKQSKLVQFFCISGIRSFLKDGVVWELGKSIDPLPIHTRIKLLKAMCESAMAGDHRFCLIREEELRLMPNAAMALYQSNYFTIHTRSEEDHICSVNEGEIANALREFFKYLPGSELVYSEKESLSMVLEAIKAAEHEAMASKLKLIVS